MSAIAAYNATIKTGSNVINNIMTYELPFKMDTVETTPFSAATPGTKTFIPTLYGAQIKCSGSWDKADTNGQLALETNFFARTKTNFVFSPNGTNTYTLSGWITDYVIKADPKTKVDVDFTFLMDGGVTLA